MAQINNGELIKGLIDGAKINTSIEKVPNQLADKIVPVMEVNPDLLRKTNVLVTNNNPTGATIYTTPANKKFYITFILLSANATVAGANVLKLHFAQDGQTELIFTLVPLFCTVAINAVNKNISLTFPPILLKKSSLIRTSVDGTVGTVQATIGGYLVED